MTNVRIENWGVFMGCLHGQVHGHPEHEDGKAVTTSRITDFDPKAKTVTTRSRTYELGAVDPRYSKSLKDPFQELAEIAAAAKQPAPKAELNPSPIEVAPASRPAPKPQPKS